MYQDGSLLAVLNGPIETISDQILGVQDMKEDVNPREHYDRLARSGHGTKDPPFVQSYMARWDGPLFYESLGDLVGKNVLEVGIGYGRIAREVVERGCESLTGLDISSATLAVARRELEQFANIELALVDICDFDRIEDYDVVYSVLTLMHIQDKHLALRNMVRSLCSGGRIVLSIDRPSGWLDFGDWRVKLYPWPPAHYVATLESLGCSVDAPIPLVDKWVDPQGKKSASYGEIVATLVRGTKK